MEAQMSFRSVGAARPNAFLTLLRDRRGSVAITSATVMGVLLVGAGLAVDIGQAYAAKARLQSAVDAAALAVGTNSPNATSVTAQMQTVANDFVSANAPSSSAVTVSTPTVAISGQTASVSAAATVQTAFMQVVGVDNITVQASSTVMRALTGLEVVLALDNTGSLGLTNLNTLKVAAYNLVQQLFGTTNGSISASSSTVRVGLVPYVASVNPVPLVTPDVSASAQSAIIGKLIGSGYGSNTAPNPLAYGPGVTTKWWGCVIENTASTFATVSSASSSYANYSYASLNVSSLESGLNTYSTNASATQYIRPPDVWKTVNRSQVCTIASSWPFTVDGGAANATIPDQTCANSYAWPPSTSTGVPKSMAAWYAGNDDGSNGGQGSDYGPNQSCPPTPVVPLTGNSAQLVAELGVTVSNGTATATDASGMIDWHQGGTTGSLGLAWAYRVLEPTSNGGLYSPVSTSSGWNDPQWQKILVIMTDGANDFYTQQYTGYGPYQTTFGNYDTTGATSYGTYAFSGVSYNKMLEMQEMAVCDTLKSHGVTIYTLFFNDGSSPGPAIGYCSGPPNTAGHPATINGTTFDYSPYTLYATNASQLTAAFSTIGTRLSKLRISQ
jgi:Flp pilus assembly protein TadG